MSLTRLLDDAVVRYGEHNAVRDGQDVWTYRELADYTRLARGRLAELGIGPSSRILSLLPGDRAFAALIFAALGRGSTLVPSAEEISDYQLRWLLADSEPSLVVTTAPRLARVKTLTSTRVVMVTDLLSGNAETTIPDADLAVSEDPAFLLYTSGSTGRPKGIVCPHGAVDWTARAIASTLGYQTGDIIYNAMPVSFDYGIYQLFLCMQAGAELVFRDSTSPAWGMLRDIRDCHATVMPLVPTLGTLVSRLAARDRRPTALRLITSTGAALTTADARGLRAAFPGVALRCMYGMTECKRISIAAPDEDLEFPGTVGRALPGTRLFITDSQGRPKPSGQVGEIMSAGPHVMLGYWNRSPADPFVRAPDDLSRAVRTGDYGFLDDEGRLYVLGRRDELFKRRGVRMNSQEVEIAAADVPGVSQAACLPPGPDGVLTIWVVSEHEPRHILRELTTRLGVAKVPDRCVVVKRLPHTPHGKVDKTALLNL